MSYKIHLGDNVATLKNITDNSIDSIITDPPYGIEFLDKDWDKNTGALECWRECFRVLKPGGYILAFSAARTYHQLATNIESVGFEIRDQLMWLYSSGFPKAQDIGKAIQKRQGVEKYKEIDLDAVTECAGRTGSGGGINRMMKKLDAKGDQQDGVIKQVIPTSPEAQKWAGWKTALKPAHEPIVMARKPFKGSAIDNVLKHGVGALNIDATRIPSTPERIAEVRKINAEGGLVAGDGIEKYSTIGGENKNKKKQYKLSEGRFPSNVLGEIPDYQKYFYCPKVSRKERMPFNNHPTVKPVALMRYLIKLVTPDNSTVLDPFCGSGSTGMAAVELGHSFIGCELDANYVDICIRRIQSWKKTS